MENMANLKNDINEVLKKYGYNVNEKNSNTTVILPKIRCGCNLVF